MRKLDLFKSKLHRNHEPKKLQAQLVMTWTFLSSIETHCPLDVFTLKKNKKQKAPVCKQMKTSQPSLKGKALAAAKEL